MSGSTNRKAIPVVFVVLLTVGLLAGVGSAQTDRPEWSDDLYVSLQDAVEGYNSRVESDETGFLEQWLLRNARVNLYVTGPDGSEAVFSFRTDDRLRMSQLRHGKYTEPTLRVQTSRAAINRITAAEDKRAAISSEFWTGAIRVKRIYPIVPGLLIAVGVREAVGVATVGGLLLAGASKFGISGLLSYIRGTIRVVLAKLSGLIRALWQNVASIVSLITLLEKFELLSWLREKIRNSLDWLRTKATGVLSRPGRSPSEPEGTDDERK